MPLVTMPFIGRMGNLLFQYAWLRAWADQNGYELCLPPWIGERVFAVPEAVRPDKYKPDKVFGEDYCQRQECLIYTRKQVKEWFKFKDDVLEKLAAVSITQHVIGIDLVLLNIRAALDYIAADMVCISLKSYIDAMKKVFGDGEYEYDLELDTHATRLPNFIGDPSASGLGTTEVCLPSFYRLMTAPILFRANSSFSWWSATLSDGRVFSPFIEGMKEGVPNQHCDNWIEGNWPRMSLKDGFTDLHLKES